MCGVRAGLIYYYYYTLSHLPPLPILRSCICKQGRIGWCEKEDDCPSCRYDFGESEQVVEDDVDTSTEEVEVAFACLTHEDARELLNDKKPEQIPEVIPQHAKGLLVCSAHPNGPCPYPRIDTNFFNFQLDDKKDDSK